MFTFSSVGFIYTLLITYLFILRYFINDYMNMKFIKVKLFVRSVFISSVSRGVMFIYAAGLQWLKRYHNGSTTTISPLYLFLLLKKRLAKRLAKLQLKILGVTAHINITVNENIMF